MGLVSGKYVCEVLSQSVDKIANDVCYAGVARVRRNFPVSCTSFITCPLRVIRHRRCGVLNMVNLYEVHPVERSVNSD